MIGLSNARPNRKEASFIIIIIIIIIIIVRDLRVIGIDKNEKERISRHFSDNCVQRRVFFVVFFIYTKMYVSSPRENFEYLD